MPLYEYQCDKCGDAFEVMQKFSDEPLTVHEKCGGSVHRLLSVPALQFKGSGWYITDYAKNKGGSDPSKGDSSKNGDSGKKEAAGASKTESSDSKKSTTSTSESKPSSSSDK